MKTKPMHCVCDAHAELQRAELAPGLTALRCDELVALLRAGW